MKKYLLNLVTIMFVGFLCVNTSSCSSVAATKMKKVLTIQWKAFMELGKLVSIKRQNRALIRVGN